ncbi:MAG: type II toxin-antitoxin system VapC family toxin [Actinomycetes bacterium]
MIVLDASALVELAVSPRTSAWVIDRLAGEDAVAPGHQPAEVISALARLARAGLLSESDLPNAFDAVSDTDVNLRHISSAHLSRALALRPSIRVTDGLYVALAEELACPLVTTDRRLARSVTTCQVLAPPI